MSTIPPPVAPALTGAIQHLEALERELAVRLDATRGALGYLRDVAGPAPAEPAPGKAERPAARGRTPKPGRNKGLPAGASLPSALRTALSKGPLPVSEAVARGGVSRYTIAGLVRSGALQAAGRTNSRRVALPGALGAAKEAP